MMSMILPYKLTGIGDRTWNNRKHQQTRSNVLTTTLPNQRAIRSSARGKQLIRHTLAVLHSCMAYTTSHCQQNEHHYQRRIAHRNNPKAAPAATALAPVAATGGAT